jgi:hypothetical protein
MSETKFHTHTEPQTKLQFCIFLFLHKYCFENKQTTEEILESEKGEPGGERRKLHTEELCVYTLPLKLLLVYLMFYYSLDR